jgi:hypothetical protein
VAILWTNIYFNKRCVKISGAYKFKSGYDVLKSQRLTWVLYMKLYERCVQLWIMYGLSILKLSNFCGNIMDKYMFSYHLKKLTKFWYYCYYYVVIWRKSVWIVPRRQFKFSSIFRNRTIMGHMSIVVIFYNFSYLIRCTCSSIWN